MLHYKVLNRPKVVHWQHFDRKNYSAFRSLGRVVALSVLSVSTLASATVAAQTTDSAGSFTLSQPGEDSGGPEVDLEEVEVTAPSLGSLAAGRTARLVSIITPQEIKASSAESISDILKLASQVDVRQRGNFGVQTDISIEGGTFDQVTILLNGVNITAPQTGHYSADWPVDINEIVRVEVLEGAASRISGGSSLLGAINIVTKPDSENGLFVTAEGGSYATFGGSAIVSQANKTVRNQVSGSYKRSDGGTINSGFSRGQGFYQGSLTTRLVDVNWQAGLSDLSHGANTFYSAAYPNQHDHIRRYIVSAGAVIKTRVKLEPMVYWHRLKDHFQLIEGTPTGENFHRTDVVGARLNASLDWVAGTTTAGAETRHESILSTNLGRPHEPVRCNDTINYIYGESRTGVSLYLDHNVALGPVTLSAGFVAAYNSGFDHRFHFYPGVDASWLVARGLRIYGTWSRSYRLPTFTDLYYKTVTHEGNRDLKPEEMNSFQLGVKFFRPVVSAKVYAFYHRGHHMLDWVMYTPDDVYHSTGFDLRNIGFSLEADVRLDQWLGKRQPLETFTAGYTYITQKRFDRQEIYKSNYALEYLRHKLTLSLRHRIVKNLTATWSLRWQERNGSYIVYENHQATGTLKPYSPYATLDLKLQYKLKNWELFVNATNLTNVRYQDLGSIPQPGFWIMGGASFTLR